MSVSDPARPAAATRSCVAPAACSGWDKKTLTLVCPASARLAISVAVAVALSTGCRNQSAAASLAAPAISRATASVIDSPGNANVMFPMVVMPPARAASEPLQKSSTQIGSLNSLASAGYTRWT
jgi:hypothetical protein